METTTVIVLRRWGCSDIWPSSNMEEMMQIWQWMRQLNQKPLWTMLRSLLLQYTLTIARFQKRFETSCMMQSCVRALQTLFFQHILMFRLTLVNTHHLVRKPFNFFPLHGKSLATKANFVTYFGMVAPPSDHSATLWEANPYTPGHSRNLPLPSYRSDFKTSNVSIGFGWNCSLAVETGRRQERSLMQIKKPEMLAFHWHWQRGITPI